MALSRYFAIAIYRSVVLKNKIHHKLHDASTATSQILTIMDIASAGASFTLFYFYLICGVLTSHQLPLLA